MSEREVFDSHVGRGALLTAALAVVLVVGAILLVGGDWLPGAIIVVAALVGLTTHLLNLRHLAGRDQPRPGTT